MTQVKKNNVKITELWVKTKYMKTNGSCGKKHVKNKKQMQYMWKCEKKKVRTMCKYHMWIKWVSGHFCKGRES